MRMHLPQFGEAFKEKDQHLQSKYPLKPDKEQRG